MSSAQHKREVAEASRKQRNMRLHFMALDGAVEKFKEWPTVTAINNLRSILDLIEQDIRSGDAAIAKATGSAS